MSVKRIRFCQVNDNNDEMVKFFDALGLVRKSDCEPSTVSGAIFEAGDNWLEQWQSSEEMPAGLILQLEVDDADVYASNLQEQGYELYGPMEQHGEKMYFVTAPNGLQLAVLNKL